MMDDETTEPETTEEAAPEAAADDAAPATDDAAPAEEAAAPAEPEEILHPKERRRRKRQRGAAALPQRSGEERHAERQIERARKAKQRRSRREKEKAARKAAGPAAERELPQLHPEKHAPRPKVRQGVVVSAKPEKTIVVRIDDARRHRRYEKIVRTSTKVHAHDETNDAGEGDTVRVIETRPMSRTKRWRLVEILERAK